MPIFARGDEGIGPYEGVCKELDEYLVPTQFGEDEFIEKKSRFIGRLWPVEDRKSVV